MTMGVPLVVLPFSTDQFAGAAALEDAGFGVVLPPNTATVAELANAVLWALDLPARPALATLSAGLRQEAGSRRAFSAVTSVPTS